MAHLSDNPVDFSSIPPAYACNDPQSLSPQPPSNAPVGPVAPRSQPSQYPTEGDGWAKSRVPAAAPSVSLPPPAWDQTVSTLANASQMLESETGKIHLGAAQALTRINPELPTPTQIMEYLKLAQLTKLAPVITPELWFTEMGLEAWYKYRNEMPGDVNDSERMLLNIRKLCQEAMNVETNPGRSTLFEQVKHNANLLHERYAKRLKEASRKVKRAQSNKRAQDLYRLRKTELTGGAYAEEMAELQKAENEWKAVCGQRKEVMGQWDDYVRSFRERYVGIRDRLYAKMQAAKDRRLGREENN